MIAIIVATVTTISDNNDNATNAAISISLINSPLHIIDHGSLVYLILLQIRFIDQQDSLLLLENNNNTVMEYPVAISDGIFSAVDDAVTRTTTSYTFPSCNIDSSTTADNDKDLYYVVMKVYDMTNDTLVSVSVSVTDEATHNVSVVDEASSADTVTMTTQVYSSPSSSESSNDHVAFLTVANETYFADIDTSSSGVMVTTTTLYESYIDERTPVVTTSSIITTKNTTLFESHSIVHDRIFSTMKTTVFNEFPFAFNDGTISTAVKMMTNDMNAAVYFAVIDAESSADITNTATSYASLSYDIDTESSAVSIADEATSAISCHSLNYFSLISSCHFDQITLVLSTLLSLHRTLYLIITYLLLLISNPYFDTISC